MIVGAWSMAVVLWQQNEVVRCARAVNAQRANVGPAG